MPLAHVAPRSYGVRDERDSEGAGGEGGHPRGLFRRRWGLENRGWLEKLSSSEREASVLTPSLYTTAVSDRDKFTEGITGRPLLLEQIHQAWGRTADLT